MDNAGLGALEERDLAAATIAALASGGTFSPHAAATSPSPKSRPRSSGSHSQLPPAADAAAAAAAGSMGMSAAEAADAAVMLGLSQQQHSPQHAPEGAPSQLTPRPQQQQQQLQPRQPEPPQQSLQQQLLLQQQQFQQQQQQRRQQQQVAPQGELDPDTLPKGLQRDMALLQVGGRTWHGVGLTLERPVATWTAAPAATGLMQELHYPGS